MKCADCDQELRDHIPELCEAKQEIRRLKEEIEQLKNIKKKPSAYIPSRDLDNQLGGKRVDIFD